MADLPRQIAVAMARLEATLPVEMIDTLAQFADEWGVRSQALGWTIDDLFGLPPIRSLASVLRPGSTVAALSAATATVRHASGEDDHLARTSMDPSAHEHSREEINLATSERRSAINTLTNLGDVQQ
jgi:hypothetical protein